MRRPQSDLRLRISGRECGEMVGVDLANPPFILAMVKKVAMIESLNPGWNDLASLVCAERDADRHQDV